MNKHTFLVAELSANHNQDIELAKRTIAAAKEVGADAVKLQTYTADTITLDSDKPIFRTGDDSLWAGQTLYSLYQKAYTPWEWHGELYEYGRSLGLVVFSTPFDLSAVDFLEELKNPIYKIASFEANDIPLIEYAASKGRPMVISTGLSDIDEIGEAVNSCKKVGNEDITLLVCTSEYPARPEDARLLNIPELAKRFNVKVGLSDHTIGCAVACAAVSLGACLIEKHFTLKRDSEGVDSAFSTTPDEFAQMVHDIRIIEKAVSGPDFTYGMNTTGRSYMRSLFAVKPICAGEKFTPENIRSIRPGAGLPPKHYNEILGKTAACSIPYGEPLKWEHIAEK